MKKDQHITQEEWMKNLQKAIDNMNKKKEKKSKKKESK